MKKKEISRKNYALFALLCIGTIFLCFYLSSWYKTITEYKKNSSVIKDVLSEIEIESFSSYLMDNPDVIVYISSTTDEDIKKFDKQFKKIIVENALDSTIILLDMSKEENSNVSEVFKNNYLDKNISLKEIVYPNLILFEEGKITNILYTKKTNINKNDVMKFLESNEIIIND